MSVGIEGIHYTATKSRKQVIRSWLQKTLKILARDNLIIDAVIAHSKSRDYTFTVYQNLWCLLVPESLFPYLLLL